MKPALSAAPWTPAVASRSSRDSGARVMVSDMGTLLE